MTNDEIGWDRRADLHGIKDQGATYQRGGKISSGTLLEMVNAAAEYEANGYIALMIVTDGPSYQGDQITELRRALG